jgi:hypothetical protein
MEINHSVAMTVFLITFPNLFELEAQFVQFRFVMETHFMCWLPCQNNIGERTGMWFLYVLILKSLSEK